MIANIKALTFDTGGTILDWHHGISRAFATAGARRGLQADWPTITNAYRRRSLQAMLNAEHPTFTIDDVDAVVADHYRSAPGEYVPMRGKVADFLRRNAFPLSIDMFLHDSSHSYGHMLWEFRQFWPRLRDGGLLVSHDVQMNAAFPEFVAKTYAHDKKTGRRDAQRTSHYEWGRWGYIGFAIKKG